MPKSKSVVLTIALEDYAHITMHSSNRAAYQWAVKHMEKEIQEVNHIHIVNTNTGKMYHLQVVMQGDKEVLQPQTYYSNHLADDEHMSYVDTVL